MQQMHQGQISGPPNTVNQPYTPLTGPMSAVNASVPPPLQGPPGTLSANASSLDDLVSGAAKDADNKAPVAQIKTEETKLASPQQEDKKGKKEKDKKMKLIYSDNETSPEEKMAKLPRYAFNPSG